MKHLHTKKQIKSLHAILLVTASTVAAFSLGFRSAEDGRSVVDPIMASSGVQGDLSRDGQLTNDDATIAIEIAAGLRAPTPEELKNDPNKDGKITTADSLWILDHMRNAAGKWIRNK